MGRDKARLTLNDARFIDRLASEFSSCGDVFISAAHEGDYADVGLPVAADENQGIGPMEGIRQALLRAREDYVFVCATDMPFLKRAAADYLAEFISSDYDAWVFTGAGRVHPLCAIYRRSLLPAVEQNIVAGRYRLMDTLNRARAKYVPLEMSSLDPRALMNVNTPEEYRAILGPAVFCVRFFIDDGLSVGVIKHDGHDFTCDIPGTDSYRFYKAGAKSVAVYSAEQSFLHVRGGVGVEALIAHMGDRDVVILEGLKASSYPKVEGDGVPAGDADLRMLRCGRALGGRLPGIPPGRRARRL